nr:hypothetical protein [uncultured Oscillibacter sp.]
MKKPIAAAVICALCAMAAAGFLYAAIFQKRSEKDNIIAYVQTNQEAMEQFVTGLVADPPEDTAYNGWRVSYYPAVGMVEFITKGSGIGSSTVYEGFYYSEDDRPIGFQGTEADFTKDESGWSWEEENGDNHERTEKITARWYWFQMNF